MKDWRLMDPPDFIKKKSFKKVIFPDFWNNAYALKNDFYKLIKCDAENFVKNYNRGEEYLKDDKIQDFWHEHCIFCTAKIMTRNNMECYCADNYSIWICKECYEDFNVLFDLKLE